MYTPGETFRAELETTRLAFHELLNSIPDQALDFKGPDNAWSIRSELWHITQSLDFLAPALIMVHRGRTSAAVYLRFPVRIRSWINGYMLVPLLARRATRQGLARGYDRAHQRIMVELDRPPGPVKDPGAKYPPGYQTITDLFHQPADHFQIHAARINQNLALYRQK